MGLMEWPGPGRGVWGPDGRDCRSLESHGPGKWGLSWKAAQSKAFSSSSWKPPAHSSQQCGSTLNVLSPVELSTHTCDLTCIADFPLLCSSA